MLISSQVLSQGDPLSPNHPIQELERSMGLGHMCIPALCLLCHLLGPAPSASSTPAQTLDPQRGLPGDDVVRAATAMVNGTTATVPQTGEKDQCLEDAPPHHIQFCIGEIWPVSLFWLLIQCHFGLSKGWISPPPFLYNVPVVTSIPCLTRH